MNRSLTGIALRLLALCALIGGAAALVGRAGDVLIDACAVAALAAGFALAAWRLLVERLARHRHGAEEPSSEIARGVESSLSILALLLIAWGAAVPLLHSWWENRTSEMVAIVAGTIGAVVVFEGLRLRALARQGCPARRPEEPPAEAAVNQLRRLRWWLVGLALLLFVGGGFGFSTWVGFHVRKDQEFNWELFGVVGTAVGTSLLALMTGFVALITAGDVEASREIAQTGREDREARTRPIVLVEKVELTVISHGPIDVAITLRNAGVGVAVRGALQLRYLAGVTTLVEEVIHATSLVSGETRPFAAQVTPSQTIPSDWRRPDWSLSGVFLDATGHGHELIDGQPEEPVNRVTVSRPPGRLSL